MGGNLSAKIFEETPVTAVIFLRITGGFAIFFRRSTVIVEQFRPKFRPGCQLSMDVNLQGAVEETAWLR